VQEAFLKLQADFASVRQPQAWLYRTVHNLAMNQLRAARRVTPLEESGEKAGRPDEISGPTTAPDEHIQRLEAIGQTRLCLKALDARSRELLRLKFEEGLSYKEISDRTNSPSATSVYPLSCLAGPGWGIEENGGDFMSTESNRETREQWEIRIVAWLLGEAAPAKSRNYGKPCSAIR